MRALARAGRGGIPRVSTQFYNSRNSRMNELPLIAVFSKVQAIAGASR